MSTPFPENQHFVRNSQTESVEFIKNEIVQDITQHKTGEPVVLLDWWSTSELFKNNQMPAHLLKQAKLELLFQNTEREFREFPPIWLYTVRQEIPKKDEEKLKTAIDLAAITFEETHGFPFRYSGFFTPSSTNSDTMFYNYTHYPRTRQPLINYKHCLGALSYLEHSMSLQGIEPRLSSIRGAWNETRIARIKGKDCRILLGAEEVYNSERKEGESAKIYSIEEVKKLVGEQTTLRGAKIFSVGRKADGTASHYEEDAFEVLCPLGELPRVYLAAKEMRQARFTVDAFRKGISYTVELRDFCSPQQADPIPSISEWLTNPEYEFFLNVTA